MIFKSDSYTNLASATEVCIAILSLKPFNNGIVTDIFRHKKGPRKILVTSLATEVLEFHRRIVGL